jgi:hypothetical protein
MVDFDLKYAVIQLHDIARLVEAKVGQGKLSQDIRVLADRLEQVLQPVEK